MSVELVSSQQSAPDPASITDFQLLELLQDATIIFDPSNERVLEVNRRACALYGFTREEFLQLSLENISLDVLEGKSHLNALLEAPEGEIATFESTQIRKDHTPVVVRIQAQIIQFQGRRCVLSINRDITELRRAERALEQSEERFGRIFSASPAATALITPSGWIVDANQSFQQLTGLKRDQIVNHNVHELNLFEEDFGHIIQRLFERQHLINQEMLIRTPHSESRYTISSFEWIELSSELCVLAQFFDLTERKRAEDELKRSEARYRQLLEEARRQSLETELIGRVRGIVVREMDQEAVIRAVVDGIRELYGYSHVSLYFVEPDGLHLKHQVGYDSVIEVLPLTGSVSGRVATTGQPMLIRDVNTEPDFIAAVPGLQSEVCVPLIVEGTVVGILNVETSQGYRLDDEDLALMVALSEHVSLALQRARLYNAEKEQRQRAETLARTIAELYAESREYATQLEARVEQRTAQFQQAKEQVEAILNASSDIIVLLDSEGRIRQNNPAFVTGYGLSGSATVGEPFSNYLDASSLDEFMAALRRTLSESTMQRLEVIAQRQDGTQFPAEVVIDFVRRSGRSEPGAVCSLRDITQRRRLENDLREALDNERRLVELKSRFGAMASHEFRTPLAIIRTSTDLLMKHYDRMSPARRTEGFQSIIGQVQHLTNLIDDLLTISRADTIGSDFNPTPTDLPAFCAALTKEVQWLASRTHSVIFSESGHFEPIMIDRSLMRRALLNLLTNAVKYSPNARSVWFHVEIDASNLVTITVRDEGIGIPAVDVTQLFETFFRASNARHIPGTGLGLAIVKRAVDAHRGTVNVVSELGKGTQFIITFPATFAPVKSELERVVTA